MGCWNSAKGAGGVEAWRLKVSRSVASQLGNCSGVHQLEARQPACADASWQPGAFISAPKGSSYAAESHNKAWYRRGILIRVDVERSRNEKKAGIVLALRNLSYLCYSAILTLLRHLVLNRHGTHFEEKIVTCGKAHSLYNSGTARFSDFVPMLLYNSGTSGSSFFPPILFHDSRHRDVRAG